MAPLGPLAGELPYVAGLALKRPKKKKKKNQTSKARAVHVTVLNQYKGFRRQEAI